MEINVLILVMALVTIFIIMENLIALMIVIMNLLLNINQLKIKYAMTIAPNFQIFFIMIKTKSNAILNVVLILILDIF